MDSILCLWVDQFIGLILWRARCIMFQLASCIRLLLLRCRRLVLTRANAAGERRRNIHELHMLCPPLAPLAAWRLGSHGLRSALVMMQIECNKNKGFFSSAAVVVVATIAGGL